MATPKRINQITSKEKNMKKILVSLLLPMSLPMFADRHIEGLSLKKTQQDPFLSPNCLKKISMPKETVQKNLEKAGFSDHFIQESRFCERNLKKV